MNVPPPKDPTFHKSKSMPRLQPQESPIEKMKKSITVFNRIESLSGHNQTLKLKYLIPLKK